MSVDPFTGDCDAMWRNLKKNTASSQSATPHCLPPAHEPGTQPHVTACGNNHNTRTDIACYTLACVCVVLAPSSLLLLLLITRSKHTHCAPRWLLVTTSLSPNL